jgi:hypothetical protein
MQFLQENSINARNLQPKIIFDVFVIGETDSLSATSKGYKTMSVRLNFKF